MPLVRKVLPIGGSRCVTLPKSWLEYYEKEMGQKVTELAIEVDKVLVISPIFEKKEVPAQ